MGLEKKEAKFCEDEGGTPAEQIDNYGPGKNPNILDETINKGYGKKEDILLEEVVNAIPKYLFLNIV